MGKVHLILLVGAVGVLVLGSASSLYVTLDSEEAAGVTVNGHPYTMATLLADVPSRSLPDLAADGIALDRLIVYAEVTDPEARQYRIIGEDGYQKTVTWENLRHGLLTEDRQAVFSDLPKAFNVRDVATIEVS
jgi:hypothetical protein